MATIDEKTRVSCLTWHGHMQGRLMNALARKSNLVQVGVEGVEGGLK